MAWFMEDILHEEDFLMTFDELELKKLTFVNLALVKTTFPKIFVADKRPKTSFPPT